MAYAAAKIPYNANELLKPLSASPATCPAKPKGRSGKDNKGKSRSWTPERRAKQAARIRIWAPWAKSSGPKTAAGKAKSSQNAYKHGNRAADMRLMTKALAAHSRFLHSVNALITLKKRGSANELLNGITQRVGRQGQIAAVLLRHALLTAEIGRLRPPPPRNRCNLAAGTV